ncbi:UNVERIFIED_CONTAM: hypothetical protein Sangu_1822500 [Sesamum angustifolium]|uniref:Uncharacterized protein n=1 Tax=Sesamum angustifolium TaxID=2727405 RepID=A0AAW2MA65_9LAMI
MGLKQTEAATTTVPCFYSNFSLSFSSLISTNGNKYNPLLSSLHFLHLGFCECSNNPGLACIALQYIKAFQGDCSVVGGPKAKRPADSEFAETFAPNCGVEVSTLAPITGRLLGCQSKYVKPSEAFSEILMKNEKSLEIVHSKNHSEVGAAVSGSDGGAPYFWCVLFSSGKSNSSFVPEAGVAKITRPGCFSGANDACSGAVALSRNLGLRPIAVAGLIALAYVMHSEFDFGL